MADPAEPRKLYQQVARAVEEAIRGGAFPPDGRLPSERDLAERYNVSRPTVREAMIALEIRGLVESRHGSGIYVVGAPPPSSPDEADLDIGPFELTEARRVVEGETAALAALSITDQEVQALTALLGDMAEEVGPETDTLKGAADQADRRFHMLIASATRNSALINVVETLWDLRYRSPLCREMLARARSAGDRPRIDEHRAILDALATRDPTAARKAMRDHLNRVIEGLLQATESEAVERARRNIADRRTAYARRAEV